MLWINHISNNLSSKLGPGRTLLSAVPDQATQETSKAKLINCLAYSSTSTGKQRTFSITRLFHLREVLCSNIDCSYAIVFSWCGMRQFSLTYAMTTSSADLPLVQLSWIFFHYILYSFGSRRPSILLSTIPIGQSYTSRSAFARDRRCRQKLWRSSGYVVHGFFCRWQTQTHSSQYAILRWRLKL